MLSDRSIGSCVFANNERGEIAVHTPGGGDADVKTFTFDSTYGPEYVPAAAVFHAARCVTRGMIACHRSTQRQIYDITASPIVESVMNGFNGTIFAYGQTGAGKSFTMEGVPTDAALRVRHTSWSCVAC